MTEYEITESKRRAPYSVKNKKNFSKTSYHLDRANKEQRKREKKLKKQLRKSARLAKREDTTC